MEHTKPIVGDIYRDTYGEKIGKNLRRIKIIEVLPNGVRADVLTDEAGLLVKRARITTLQFKTLHAGYVLWEVES